MDSDAVQIVLAYWRLQAAAERTPSLSVIVAKIGTA
jgi:hypothetical protein